MIRTRKNNKGQTNLVRNLIIMVLLILIAVVIISKSIKSLNKGGDCVNNGGVCTNECDMFTQISIMGDTAAGCESGQKCCRSIIKPKPPHAQCKGKDPGTPCETSMYCDEGSQCVNKCEFCSKNFGVESEKNIQKDLCGVKEGTTTFEQLKNASGGKQISCGCKSSECKPDGTNCVRNVCTGKDNNYVCCFR